MERGNYRTTHRPSSRRTCVGCKQEAQPRQSDAGEANLSRALSLSLALSLAYAHTHTETFLSMLQMSKWQKPGNSKDSDAHTARTPTRREVYTSCRPAQQIVLSLGLSLSLGRDSLSRASLFSCSFSLKFALSQCALLKSLLFLFY